MTSVWELLSSSAVSIFGTLVGGLLVACLVVWFLPAPQGSARRKAPAVLMTFIVTVVAVASLVVFLRGWPDKPNEANPPPVVITDPPPGGDGTPPTPPSGDQPIAPPTGPNPIPTTGTPPPIRVSFINPGSFSGTSGIPVAVKSSQDDDLNTYTVLEAFGIPLQREAFKPAFFKEGLFDRLIAGNPADLPRLNLPQGVDRILLVRLGEPRRSAPTGSRDATQLAMTVTVTAFDIQTSSLLKTLTFEAAGVAFDNEQMLHESLRESVTQNLRPLIAVLPSAGMLASDGGGIVR